MRWRCKHYGVSSVERRSGITGSMVFTAFIGHLTTGASFGIIASRVGCSPRTLQRHFESSWLVDVPDPAAGHIGRVYDQVFLDGAYTAGGCLTTAVTTGHAIAWHWYKHGTTRDYQRLLERVEAPLIAIIDDGQGVLNAIKKCWPITRVQCCLVRAQRAVCCYTTSRPRADARRTTYRLALELTRTITLDQAAAWGAQLHGFSTIYRSRMDERTAAEDPGTGTRTCTWTRHNVYKAYNSLNHPWCSELLFIYLTSPEGVLKKSRIKSTINSLEGGINSQIKLLARTHYDRSGERRRRILDWWLCLKTELPNDPARIARQFDQGQDQLAKVSTLTQHGNQADHETRRPALYGNATDTDRAHSIGIQKGQI